MAAVPVLLSGAAVGLSLGLTGGGGSLFAVPLLVYGLGADMSTAAALSLTAVGLSSAFGAALQWRLVKWPAALIFAAGGAALTPAGAWLSHHLPRAPLLVVFALLMIYAGWRMWKGRSGDAVATGPCVTAGPAKIRAACVLRLLGGGALAGILSGLFGVGGGFIIVPVLVFVTGMVIQSAVATSLPVIALVSAAGILAHLHHGTEFPAALTLQFTAGAFAGMMAGIALRSKLPPQRLRQVFASAMWLLGAWILVRR